ncbi:MAG: tetratricopeptide repeat protein [Myxococcota bacterium]
MGSSQGIGGSPRFVLAHGVNACVRTAFALSLLCASAAAAQDADAPSEAEERARVHFDAGRNHYNAGAYEAALGEFETAYELSERSDLLYNIYLSLERLGQLDRALEALDRYIAEADDPSENREQLDRRRELLQERISEDGVADDVSSSSSPGNLVPAIAAFAVAGAGLISFGVFGGLALAEDSDLSSGCGEDESCGDAQLENLDRYNLLADISWITAAVAATAGVVLLLTVGLPGGEPNEDRSPQARSWEVLPWVAPAVGGVPSVGLSVKVRSL